MKALNTLSTVGVTGLNLQDLEFLSAGDRVLIAAVDSVATATLNVKYGSVDVFDGPLPIEPGTDMIEWPANIVTMFTAQKAGKMIATLGGTVAGARVNFLVLAPGEPIPW